MCRLPRGGEGDARRFRQGMSHVDSSGRQTASINAHCDQPSSVGLVDAEFEDRSLDSLIRSVGPHTTEILKLGPDHRNPPLGQVALPLLHAPQPTVASRTRSVQPPAIYKAELAFGF